MQGETTKKRKFSDEKQTEKNCCFMDLFKIFDKKSKKGDNSEKRGSKNNNTLEPDEKRPASAQSSNGVDQAPCDYAKYVKVLEDFIFATEKLGIDGLSKQYRKLDQSSDSSATFEAFKQNMYKNRYSDVLCRDSSRVKLLIDSSRQGDYIHANYVKTPYLCNTFLCTQGPLQTTIPDFWRMVFQERASSILMLCRTIEEGRPKCVAYWPEVGEEVKYGCLVVKNMSESQDESNSFEIIELSVNFVADDIPQNEQPVDKTVLLVKLIKWPNWPDRGVPDEKCHTVPRRLLDRVRHGSCVVHCSAGIGRTGCMVALEFAYRRLDMGMTLDFEKIAIELRKQRAQCIQTEIQYLYIHRVMIAFSREIGISEKARISAESFLKSYDDHLRSKP
ncbi:unnamed protein product [Caenorhabditis angaria]|uniref:Protein-tyrosine phosphatase n=1 Tax=Caenorhabditis angaria TaxID=860376 RepID=A0A9P1IFI8_9PELO|nr:unnamed protein product [Caenorhabditis angaria]